MMKLSSHWGYLMMILTPGLTARAGARMRSRLNPTMRSQRYSAQLRSPLAAVHSSHSQSVNQKSSIMISSKSEAVYSKISCR